MPDASDVFATMRFSTDAVPKRDRVGLLREFYGPVIARLDIEAPSDKPIYFASAARVTSDLALSNMAFSPVHVRRTRALIADGNDSCVLSRLHSPGNTVTFRGREFAPPAGTGTLLSMADPFECRTTGGVAHGVSVTVPRKVLSGMVPRLEDNFGRVLVWDTEVLRLLTGYVELLKKDSQLTEPGLRRLVVTHVHDLVALAVGIAGDAAELASARGLRAARLHAIKSDIRTSLGNHGLSVTAVAARHSVTPRYVQALFADEGLTFSQYLMRERLALVHQTLQNPQHVAKSISAIAYAAGFGDISHFNRAFRRRYGATPSDVRAAAQRQDT